MGLDLYSFLIQNKILTKDQVVSFKMLIEKEQSSSSIFLSLHKSGLVKKSDLYFISSQYFKIEEFDEFPISIDNDIISKINKTHSLLKCILPLKYEEIDGIKSLICLTGDPSDVEAIDIIRHDFKGFDVIPKYVYFDDLEGILKSIFRNNLEIDSIISDLLNIKDSSKKIKSFSRIVDLIFEDAILLNVSDIHFEPQQSYVCVRYRIMGEMMSKYYIPIDFYSNLVNKVKIISKLKVSESNRPQDGKFDLQMRGRSIQMRVSSIPTIFGENIVIRILDQSKSISKISEQKNVFWHHKSKLIESMKNSEGFVVISGPTGSGKTTTLYSMLSEIQSDSNAIFDLEDPVEYSLKGISQINVNPEIGLTFSSGLKSILRQDPDVILVGEIRDEETAQLALRASITGHLVLSTIHANNILESIIRLSNMGIEPYLLASSLKCVISQRLVKVMCSKCKTSRQAKKHEVDLINENLNLNGASYTLNDPFGCQECFFKGYSERMSIMEVLEIDQELKNIMLQNSNDLYFSIKNHIYNSKNFKNLYKDFLFGCKEGLFCINDFHI